MKARRVVVTGMGMISPVGNDVAESWKNIVAGKTGIATIEQFDPSALSVRFAGEVKNFDPLAHFSIKDIKKLDPFTQYAIVASDEAMANAGLSKMDNNKNRCGVAVGSGIGGFHTIMQNHERFLQGGQRKVSPFFIPAGISNMAAGNISIRHGFKGPNITVVTACTTGTHNIGLAARMIAYGDADVMLAGGTEKGSLPLCIAGFAAAKTLSTRNEAPEKASRPWDKDRDGFVLGEGAGMMVLEEYEHAVNRGAPILAELIGFGMSGDAYHITAPDETTQGAQASMRVALDDAGLDPEAVDYINAHGTSTLLNDRIETQAIKGVFGDHAYHLAVSSTKSMTGHLLGAAGAIEAIFSVMAIRDNIAPPTINLETPEDGCDLNYVPGEAQTRDIKVALSNSFGFGGTNGTLVFRDVD